MDTTSRTAVGQGVLLAIIPVLIAARRSAETLRKHGTSRGRRDGCLARMRAPVRHERATASLDTRRRPDPRR